MTQYKWENIKLPDSRLNTLKLATKKKKTGVTLMLSSNMTDHANYETSKFSISAIAS